MTDEPLPPHLSDLVARLRRPELHPSPDLRARVLASINAELRQSRPFRWRSAIAAAAVLMIGANLSLIAASLPPERPHHSTARETARLIHQLAPDLSPDDAARLSLFLAAAGDAPRVPLVQSHSTVPGALQ